MSTTMQQALTDVLACLNDTNEQALQPPEAQQRLRAVQASYPQIGMELIWQRESYDQSLQYDVLLRPRDGATVSLSISPPQTLPWPLRGVQRWNEANLVQVNGKTLTMADAVAFLDVLLVGHSCGRPRQDPQRG